MGDSDKHVLAAGNPKALDIPALLQQADSGSGGGALSSSLFTDDDF